MHTERDCTVCVYRTSPQDSNGGQPAPFYLGPLLVPMVTHLYTHTSMRVYVLTHTGCAVVTEAAVTLGKRQLQVLFAHNSDTLKVTTAGMRGGTATSRSAPTGVRTRHIGVSTLPQPTIVAGTRCDVTTPPPLATKPQCEHALRQFSHTQ